MLFILTGFLVRIFFYLAGAQYYYGDPGFVINGDTHAWVDSILNLINHGTYTADTEVFNAMFYRPPGYGFFIGIFYLITGGNMELAFTIIPFVQIMLDTLCIYFIFHITFSIFKSTSIALLCSLLYAIYPFVIVWTPIAIAESVSIFFFLGSLYFYFNDRNNLAFLSGILLGVSVLTRLQIIFIFPFLAAGIYVVRSGNFYWKKKLVLFILGFSLIYGIWPVRNYINHNRIMFSQDLNVGRNWSPDYLAFMDFIFAVQTDHKPQYDQIINFETVTWPPQAYISPNDSATLTQVIDSCRVCGTGFSYFMKHAGKRPSYVAKNENCDAYIAAEFKKLTASQKKNNPENYYIKVPLSNLYKAVFKFSLYGDKSVAVKVAGSLLFLYRTFLIFAGIAGLIILYKKRAASHAFVFITTCFVISWYLYLTFVYRNIEIRYLLPADLMLLISASYLFNYLYLNFRSRNNLNKKVSV